MSAPVRDFIRPRRHPCEPWLGVSKAQPLAVGREERGRAGLVALPPALSGSARMIPGNGFKCTKPSSLKVAEGDSATGRAGMLVGNMGKLGLSLQPPWRLG